MAIGASSDRSYVLRPLRDKNGDIYLWALRVAGMERTFDTAAECRAYAEGCETTSAANDARRKVSE